MKGEFKENVNTKQDKLQNHTKEIKDSFVEIKHIGNFVGLGP